MISQIMPHLLKKNKNNMSLLGIFLTLKSIVAIKNKQSEYNIYCIALTAVDLSDNIIMFKIANILNTTKNKITLFLRMGIFFFITVLLL